MSSRSREDSITTIGAAFKVQKARWFAQAQLSGGEALLALFGGSVNSRVDNVIADAEGPLFYAVESTGNARPIRVSYGTDESQNMVAFGRIAEARAVGSGGKEKPGDGTDRTRRAGPQRADPDTST